MLSPSDSGSSRACKLAYNTVEGVRSQVRTLVVAQFLIEKRERRKCSEGPIISPSSRIQSYFHMSGARDRDRGRLYSRRFVNLYLRNRQPLHAGLLQPSGMLFFASGVHRWLRRDSCNKAISRGTGSYRGTEVAVSHATGCCRVKREERFCTASSTPQNEFRPFEKRKEKNPLELNSFTSA